MKKIESKERGMGFTSWLQLLFIAFKLADIIDWQWWWVLAPTWVVFSMALILLIISGITKAITKE